MDQDKSMAVIKQGNHQQQPQCHQLRHHLAFQAVLAVQNQLVV
jgi:hypothetical protein